MPAAKVLIDTNVIYKTGQLAQLLKLRSKGLIKIYVSSETNEKEYNQNFKKSWLGINESKLRDLRRTGISQQQETRLMEEDKAKLDRVVASFEVLPVSEEDTAPYKPLFRDRSDAFLAGTAKKHGINNIVSADGSAVDPEKLRSIGILWERPDDYLSRLTEKHPGIMAKVFRGEKSFPASLRGFQNALESAREKLAEGQVFVESHARRGGVVPDHWRTHPVRA